MRVAFDSTTGDGERRSSAALAGRLRLWLAAAAALSQRGHVFGSTLEGTGAQAFGNASGVAVNESTGEVYVADVAHGRVESFKPNGSGGYEFAFEILVPHPEAIAIDNDLTSASHGDLYVANWNRK